MNPGDTEDFAFLSPTELTAGFSAGRISPAEVTKAALARAEALQPRLNAFAWLDAEGARAAAAKAEARWQAGEALGPLDGVPLTIKDLTAVRGLPMRRGSQTTSPEPAPEDAPAVARLRAAGAVILGKTTTPEFGWKGITDGPLFGFTRNPWDPALTPGGSSGGAAAALAAGIGALAHGTDGGGSIRIPASYCGLVGFKPSFGRVPHHPLEGAFCTTAAQGPLARSVGDAALMLQVMAQPDPRDWYGLPALHEDLVEAAASGRLDGLSLAYSPRLGGAEPTAEIRSVVEAALAKLAQAGARITEIDGLFPPLEERFHDFWLAGFAAQIRNLDAEQRDLLDPRFRDLAEAGLSIGLPAYDAAMKARADLGRRINLCLVDFDALVTPTMPTAPPPVETPYHSAAFDRWRHATAYTLAFNLSGHPACSLPCGLDERALPVGLQLIGPAHGDARLMAAAGAVERGLRFPQPHPKLKERLPALKP
jgi:aspartyl-tRNA(Asn)/glutamyl-tRNA(Gln) amidotransferase subunit A